MPASPGVRRPSEGLNLPEKATRLLQAQENCFTAAQARECGLGRRALGAAVRRGLLRPRYRGVYCLAPARAAPSGSGARGGGPSASTGPAAQAWANVRLRQEAMAAQLALGPESFACLETAARLHGLAAFPPWRGRVRMGLRSDSRRRWRADPLLRLHNWRIAPEEIVSLGRLRLTSVERTLRDLARFTSRESFVCALDSALHQGLVRGEDLEAVRSGNDGLRGVVRSRPWWLLADPLGRAASLLETRVRLICHDGGVPPSHLQFPFPVPERGRCYYGDMWWQDRHLLVEADGAGPHSTPEALFADRERQNAILSAFPDVRILRFTWADLRRPDRITALVSRTPRLR